MSSFLHRAGQSPGRAYRVRSRAGAPQRRTPDEQRGGKAARRQVNYGKPPPPWFALNLKVLWGKSTEIQPYSRRIKCRRVIQHQFNLGRIAQDLTINKLSVSEGGYMLRVPAACRLTPAGSNRELGLVEL